MVRLDVVSCQSMQAESNRWKERKNNRTEYVLAVASGVSPVVERPQIPAVRREVLLLQLLDRLDIRRHQLQDAPVLRGSGHDLAQVHIKSKLYVVLKNHSILLPI